MILLVDRGNTRTKWRFLSEDDGRTSGAEEGESFDVLRSQLPLDEGVSAILVASVASDAVKAKLETGLRALFPGVDVVHVRTLGHFRGLVAGYGDVSQLGVDRWLQLLAISEMKKLPALLVSLGTAVTVDKLDESGCHAGGQIAPGWSMLNAVVPSSTAKIDVVLSGDQTKGGLGTDTLSCLEGGVSQMFIAYLHSIADEYAEGCALTCLTGGDAERFSGALSGFLVKAGLVLDGMEVIASHLPDYLMCVDKQ